MALKLTYDTFKESDSRFTGWINEIDGVVAMGNSPEEVRDELLKILRLKWEIDRQDKKSHKSQLEVKTGELNFQISE